MQTKLQSLIEAVTNTACGLMLSYAGSFVIYPLLGMGGGAESYAVATAFFTALSIARNYFVRQFFNWQGGKGGHETA